MRHPSLFRFIPFALRKKPKLSEEVFGPTTLLVHYNNAAELLKTVHALEGHLTATILGTEDDLRKNAELIQVLETKAGRVIAGVDCHPLARPATQLAESPDTQQAVQSGSFCGSGMARGLGPQCKNHLARRSS
jgi:hypothetical protein